METTNKRMRRCSATLIIREMHIKTIMRYYLTAIRKAIIEKSAAINVGMDAEKRKPSCTVSGNEN